MTRSVLALVALILFAVAPAAAEAGRADAMLVTGARGKLMPVVEGALAQGADIESRDESGRTALIWASFHGELAMMRMLLERGADVNGADRRGRTPLIWTAILGRPAAAMLLLENGADAAMPDEAGQTAADHAAAEGHDAVTAMLRSAEPR